jgi:hypothetical protein
VDYTVTSTFILAQHDLDRWSDIAEYEAPAGRLARRRTAMTNEKTTMIVLKDAAGSYYLLSREMLDQARVPAERATEIERLMEEQDTRGFGDGDPVPLDAVPRPVRLGVIVLPAPSGAFGDGSVRFPRA